MADLAPDHRPTGAMPRFRKAPDLPPRRDPPSLRLVAAAGPVPPVTPRGRGRRRILAWLLASLLLHGLLALYLAQPRREVRDLPPSAIEVVFEGGQPKQSAAEPPQGDVPSTPSAPAAPPPPPEAGPPLPQPVPPRPAPPAPEPPRPAPPMPQPPRPAPPEPSSVEPAPPPMEAEPSPVEALPTPPPQAPPVPPRPAAPARRAAPALPPGLLWAPDGLSFNAPARPSAPAGRPTGRGLDLSVDPSILRGEASADANLQVRGAQVGANWQGAFRRWLDQHMSYPMEALRQGESGTVRVRVVAGPDGQVRSVRLLTPSGSPSLNFGTTFPFSGAQLPAFPPPVDPEGVTIDLTVNYILVRR
ncbi:energy transducer TonB [Roseomonas sp. F4]